MDMNKHLQETDRYFRTATLYVAAFLYAHKLPLVNVDTTSDQRRATFVFDEVDKAKELLHEYNYAKENASTVLVDVRTFVFAVKSLKEMLYQYR